MYEDYDDVDGDFEEGGEEEEERKKKIKRIPIS